MAVAVKKKATRKRRRLKSKQVRRAEKKAAEMEERRQAARDRQRAAIEKAENEAAAASAQLLPAQIKAIAGARTDPTMFFLLIKEILNPTPERPYILGEMARQLLQLVQDVHNMDQKRHAVSVPPQHGKSTILTIITVAWLVGRFPGIRVGITAYSPSLVWTFSDKIRDIINHPIYQLIFPNCKLCRSLQKKEEWVTTTGSKVMAKSRGMKFTGHGLDYLIIDDPHSGRADAESDVERTKVKDWFFADCLSRLSPDSKVFIIMTRWHPQDLIGTLKDPDYNKNLDLEGFGYRKFVFHNYPALSTGGPDDPLGRMEENQALFPEFKDAHFLMAERATQPAYEWESQYQGNPIPAGAGQLDISKIHRIKREDVPRNIPRARGWDLALTEKQTSDYSVGALCAWDSGTREFYILDIWRKKLVWTKMQPRLVDLARQDKEEENANTLGMEAVSGFEMGRLQVAKLLRGDVKVIKCNPPKGGKMARAEAWMHVAEARRLYVCEGDWNRAFFEELTYFPDVEHDDQVDAVSVAWETLTRRRRLKLA